MGRLGEGRFPPPAELSFPMKNKVFKTMFFIVLLVIFYDLFYDLFSYFEAILGYFEGQGSGNLS